MFNARKLFYSLPVGLRFTVRRAVYLPIDIVEKISGKRDNLTPPRGLIYTGSGDFRAQGEHLKQQFIELGGLKPEHRVLDIGSGIGRAAVALTSYLDKEKGSYEGFDVIKMGVDWCQKRITSRFPNFKFLYTSLKNDLYREDGDAAENFQFPYHDNEFDFVLLTSVFTHMQPEEVQHYLGEIQRVLKPGGTCFATFFIINETSKKLSKNNTHFNFPHDHGHYFLMDEKVKAANVAFEEKYLENTLVGENNLRIKATHYGYWSGRKKADCEGFQDIVILEKA